MDFISAYPPYIGKPCEGHILPNADALLGCKELIMAACNSMGLNVDP